MMQIDLSTQVAETAVDRLGKKIEGLADVAQRTGKRMGEGLNFAASVKQTFASLKSEHKALRSSLQEIQSAFQKANGSMQAQVTTGAALRDMSKMVSKALTSQTTAITAQTRELKGMVANTRAASNAQAKAQTEAQRYLATLLRTNAAMAKSDIELATHRQGWDALSRPMQLQTMHQIRLQHAFKDTSSLMKQQLTTMQQYQKQAAHLAMLRDEKKNNPKAMIGISEKQYATAMQNLDMWLKKVTDSENKKNLGRTKSTGASQRATEAEKGMARALRDTQKEQDRLNKVLAGGAGRLGSLTNEFHPAAQAAAAFRAALHGANLGFGIFTSQTILTAAAVYGITVGLREALSVGAKFERAFERVAVMMKSFEEIASGSAGAITKQTTAVKNMVLDLAETTQYTATEVADAASVLALSGQTAFEIYNNLGSVLDLASVGMMEMSTAADIATGMMASFSLSGNEFADAVDIIAAVSAKTKASVEDIGMSMTYIGPIAHQAGASIEQVSAALGILAENNIRGSKAGTALRRMFTNLLSPTAAGKKAFEELGINIEDVVKDGVDLGEVFQLLADKGAGIKELKNIFGQYALTSAAALKGNVSGLQALEGQLHKVEGFAAKTRDALTQNFQLAVEELQNVIQRGMIAAFDVFGPGLEKDIRALSDVLRAESGNIAKVIGDVASTIITAVKAIVENFDTIRKVVGPVFEVFGWVLKTAANNIGLVTAAFVGWTMFKTIGGLVGMLSSVLLKASTSAKAFELAQNGVNISMSKYGGFSAAYVGAISKQHAALGLLKTQMGAVAAMQVKMNASNALYMRGLGNFNNIAVGPSSPWNKMAQGATVATGAMGTLSRAIGGLGAAASRGLAFLGGWPGLLLTVAMTALPLLSGAFGDAEEQIYSFTGAIEEFQAFEDDILMMTDRVSERLTINLSRDLETAKKQVEALRAEVAKIPKKNQEALDDLNPAWYERVNAATNPIANLMMLNKMREAIDHLRGARERDIKTKEDARLAELKLADAQEASLKMTEANRVKREIEINQTTYAAEVLDGLNNIRTTEGVLLAGVAPQYDNYVEKILSTTSAFDRLKAVIDSFLEFITSGAVGNIVEMLIPPSAMETLREFRAMFALGTAPTSKPQYPLGPSYNPPAPSGDKPPGSDKDAAARIKAETAELVKYFEAYEKGTGSVAGLKRELAEISKAKDSIASGTPAATAALKEMGYTAAEAQQALDWSESEKVFEYLTQQLTKIDPRFKDLSLTMDTAKSGALDMDAALARASTILREAGFSTEFITEKMKQFAPVLNSVNDPTIKLTEEFKKLREEATTLMAQWSAPSTFDAMVKKFQGVGGAATELTLAVIRGSKIFGDFQDVMGETQRVEEAAKIIKILQDNVKETGISAEIAEKLMRKFYNSTPLGKLQEENRQLQIRMNNITRSAEDQYVLNAALSEYGSTLEGMPQGFEAAARAAYQMNQELERVNAIRDAYKQFGDGVLRTFTGLIDGTTKNFGDAMDRIKDMFKQLLAELVYMAAKNAIVMTFSGQGSAGGGGGFNWGSIISGIFGGGGTQGGGGATAGGGAGSWMSGISAMMTTLGFGQGGTTSGGAISGVLASSGVTSGGASGGGSGSGGLMSNATTWVQAGRRLWQGFSGSAAASGVPASQMSTMFGTYTPSNFMGPVASGAHGGFAPSAMGYAGAGLAAAGMAYTGYQMHQGQSGGTRAGAALSYGALGWGAAMTGMAMASGATMGAAAAGAFGSAMGASMAIPIIGWVLAAIALVDLATGGRVMGTDYRPEKYNTTVGIQDQEAFAGASIQEWRYTNANPFRDFGNWGLGQRRSRTRNIDPPDELEAAAQKFYDMQLDVAKNAARRFRNEVGPLIEGTFTQVTAFTDKGKRDEKKDTTFAEILGKKYDKITMEEFTKRMSGFQILSQIANNLTAEQIGAGGFNWSPGGGTGGAGRPGGRTDVGGEIFEGLENSEELAEVAAGWQESFNQIMSIAARWESNADDFANGAEFLLNAAVDMAHGIGLLGTDGTLAEVADLIEAVQMGEETLSETYRRVVQSVYLVESSLGGFNVAAGRTREEFVMFSEEMVSALGGVDAASTALQTFSNAFGQLEVIAQYQADQAWSARTRSLERIGLDPNTTAEEFIAAFSARLPELTGAEAADWIIAGQGLANVALGLQAMRDQLTGGQSLAEQLNRQVQNIASIGGSPADVAEARQIADQILANALSEFMRQVIGDLAAFEGDEYAFKVSEINRAMNEAITQATMLGASEDDLNMIRRRAQHQIEAIAKELADFMFGIEGQIAAIEGHPVQHHLKEIAKQMEANIRQARGLGANEQQLARIRRLAGLQMVQAINELKNSIRGLVGEFYQTDDLGQDLAAEAESQYESQREAAQSLYEQEMQRYEDAQEAIKNIAKFLTDLEMGELSPGSWQDRLGAARGNFMSLFQRAMGGDSEALSEITGAAQQFLQLGSEFYGSTTGYAEIYNLVTGMLRQLQGNLGTVTQPAPLPPDAGSGGSSSGSSDAETERDRITREAERFQLALQIAQQIGDLGLALNVSVFDLMNEFGVKLTDLAAAMGIKLDALNADTVLQLQLLSGALGVGFLDVTTALGININALALAFGIKIDELSAATFGGFAEFAGIVGVDITTMAEMLGVNISRFSEAVAGSIELGLATLPSVPEAITAGLSPFLTEIREADTSAEVRTAIENLTTWVSTLPEDQRDLLRPILEGVGLSVTGGTGAITTEVQAQIAATTALMNSVDLVKVASDGTTGAVTAVKDAVEGANSYLASIAASSTALVQLIRDGSTGGGGLPLSPGNDDTLVPGTGGGGSVGGGGLPIGSPTPIQDGTIPTSYAAQSYSLQAETLEKTEEVVERLDALTQTVDAKLEKVNNTQVEGNRDRKTIKTTTRLQGIANATSTKRGRSK